MILLLLLLMAKIRTQVMLEEHLYFWVQEKMRQHKRKNISDTLNHILGSLKNIEIANKEPQKEVEPRQTQFVGDRIISKLNKKYKV